MSGTDDSSEPGGDAQPSEDQHYHDALATVRHAIEQFQGCSAEERNALTKELADLESMADKLAEGRIEIVLFGEIDTGKSALINALIGEAVAQVDVRGGWTKDIWSFKWGGAGYVVPGLEKSEVVLVDTPGINEVDGGQRAELAREAASRADVILFVTDSDLNQMEFAALAELAATNKPVLLVFNKIDNYTPEQRKRLGHVLRDERLRGIIAQEDILETAADPLPREYVIESPSGASRSEFRQPPPSVENLKTRILEVLDRDGKSLLALNAAMYAADKSDRIGALKVRMRDDRANTTIWSFAAMKAVGVAMTPFPVVDMIGASAMDVSMVITLARVYGIPLSWNNARSLIEAIVQAAGWVMAGEAVYHLAVSLFKGLTVGAGHVLTALPQGAAAGYGSYIVGQAAKYYLEHGASWGGEAPKTVVSRILQNTDKKSVLQRLQAEIKKKIRLNPHARSK